MSWSFNPKTTGTVKAYSACKTPVSAWISAEKMKEIGADINDVLFVSKGWTGSLSCRAVIRGVLPGEYSSDTILLSNDCIYEGSFKVGYTVAFWKHDIWS